MLAAEASPDFPLLTATVVLPAIGALVTALVSRRRVESARLVATLFSVATAALTVAILVSFETGDAGFQMVEKTTWISDLDISWHLGIDGISLFLVVMTGVLFPIAILGAPAHHDEKPFLAWLLLLEAGCIGVFLSLDLFLFFVMFEIVLVPMYFLIAGWGYANRRYAAMKFFLYTMFGSAFMLVGLVSTAVLHARGAGTDLTFNLVTIAQDQDAIATTTARWLFLAFADRVRGEGAALPRPHVAARRPHRGADRRLGDPGRRHAEAGHLRVPALRALPVPRGVVLLRPAAADPRDDRRSSTAPSARPCSAT